MGGTNSVGQSGWARTRPDTWRFQLRNVLREVTRAFSRPVGYGYGLAVRLVEVRVVPSVPLEGGNGPLDVPYANHGTHNAPRTAATMLTHGTMVS